MGEPNYFLSQSPKDSIYIPTYNELLVFLFSYKWAILTKSELFFFFLHEYFFLEEDSEEQSLHF